jgi:hypothetical protein
MKKLMLLSLIMGMVSLCLPVMWAMYYLMGWSPNAQPSDQEQFYGTYDLNGNYFFFSPINYPIQWQNADIPLELTISEYEIAKPRYQLSNSLDSTKNILSSHRRSYKGYS